MFDNKGYTLLEILISIVIIGILTGGAVAIYYSFSGPEAKHETNIKNLNVLSDAIKRYWITNRQFPESVENIQDKGFLLRELKSPYQDDREYKISENGIGYLGNFEEVELALSETTLSKSEELNVLSDNEGGIEPSFAVEVSFPPNRSSSDASKEHVKINNMISPLERTGNTFEFTSLPVVMVFPEGEVDLVLSGVYNDGVVFEGVSTIEITD